MARPEKERRVAAPPVYTDFKPTGVPKRLLTSVDLTLDEYEAIRLSDHLSLDHAAAAAEMGVSRPTFTRLHEHARKKIARFIVEGLHLSIEGGTIHFAENLFKCDECRKIFPGPIGKTSRTCPFCKSDNVDNLAARHGHGDCCRV